MRCLEHLSFVSSIGLLERLLPGDYSVAVPVLRAPEWLRLSPKGIEAARALFSPGFEPLVVVAVVVGLERTMAVVGRLADSVEAAAYDAVAVGPLVVGGEGKTSVFVVELIAVVFVVAAVVGLDSELGLRLVVTRLGSMVMP